MGGVRVQEMAPRMCQVPYSGFLSRVKTFANYLKIGFRGENFRGLS